MAVEIIGRREELLALDAFLGAVSGGGQALLLEGDAGIGKTALWQEGNRLARESGIRALTSRSAPAEAQIAFTTLGDLFAPVVEETLPQLPPIQRHGLETALLIREPDGPPPEVRLLGLALLSVMRMLARDGPLLVGLDDVQWVDASSAEVLEFLLRRLESEPVGVLATVRGQPVEVPLELDRAFGGFQRLAVEPLSLGAIHRLLWGRLALNLPRPELVRVHEIAGGNPFFALELGRAIARGAISVDSTNVALPESLSALVTERLRVLPASVRNTLAAVAALAAPSVTVLEPLGAAAVDEIELAEKQGVVELDGDRIHFTHPLLAPACYAAMPLHKRRRLHRRLAELDVDLEERARHLAIAATGPDEGIAAALDAAAAHARARGAALAAAELAELAVALTPADEVDELNRRRITAAEHCDYAGDTSGAAELLEAVLDSSSGGAARGKALARLALMQWETKGFRVVEALCARALAEPDLELHERIDVLIELAWRAGAGRGSRDALRYAERAVQLAGQERESNQLGPALATLAEVTFRRTGRIRQDLVDRAIELRRADGDDETARFVLARLLSRSDRYEEARSLWMVLTADAARREDPALTTYLMFAARMEVNAGEWDRATDLCEQAIELAQQTGREHPEPICRMVLAEIDAYRGEAERARTEIPKMLRLAGGREYLGATHRLSRALASLELSCGDAGAAWRVTAALVADVTELDEVLGQVVGSVGIEAVIGTGDLSAAERLLALLDERAAESDTGLHLLAGRCRGLLLAAHGEREAAIEVLETATVEPDPPQGVNPLELARTLLALGTVQRRAQHKRDARGTLELAAGRFERLGARLWAARARAELGRIGGRTGSHDELSETEHQIVELVVAGRRNREVAAELSLSPNTIAWNLSKIYRKLGVSSRTELAARMTASAPE